MCSYDLHIFHGRLTINTVESLYLEVHRTVAKF